MVRFFLNAINCALLFVQLILGIIVLVGLFKIPSDPNGSGAMVLMALILMLPIGYVMHKISKKVKRNSTVQKAAAVKSCTANDVPKEALENEDLIYRASEWHKKVRPEFEIRYKGGDGAISVEKIIVLGIGDARVDAFSFTRNEFHTFYIPGIEACVDISTGELINENLMVFFIKFLYPRRKLSRIFTYDDWCEISYVVIPEELPEDLCFFKLDKTLHARIVSYKENVIEDDFYFGKIMDSYYYSDKYFIEVKDSKGEKMNVGFSKILSVENRNFVEYLLEEFNKTKR